MTQIEPTASINQAIEQVNRVPGLSAHVKLAIAGLLDQAHAPNDATEAPATLGDIRAIFRSMEIAEPGGDRLYLKIAPFDVKLQRTDEGLVVDIFAEEAGLEPIASTYVFTDEAVEEVD